ncbi:Csu type fimbrial protein [Vulcaniibacterium gelatinicum]|uniref:Csu type fimbrial protein n=1 Tax=Vulcaniibacterium gelatinicum TaxID=2598725 RepID=UPI0015F2C11D|nr:spore coat U domain-containing protein [Vulcaniibacterium gelatinicum]
MGRQFPPTANGMRRARVALAALLCAGAGIARAAECSLSTQPINFGTYDPIELFAPIDSFGAVRVGCTLTTFGELFFGVVVQVRLGTGSSGTYAARTLRQPPASVLQYNLYTSAARTTVWGDGTGGTAAVSGTVGGFFGGPNPRTFTVYARLPPGQDPSVGPHSDTVTVEVWF